MGQCVIAAKGVLQNPNDANSQAALAASVVNIAAPLAELSAVSSAYPPLSEIEALASTQNSDLNTLAKNPRDAAQRQKVADNHQKLSNLVKQESANPRLPAKASETMAQQLAELDKDVAAIEQILASGNLDKLDSAVLAAQTPLNRIADAARTASLESPSDDAPVVLTNAIAKAKTLVAALKAAKAGKGDVKEIQKSSQNLARTLAELVGYAKSMAYAARGTGQLSAAAEQALALDELLTNLASLGTESTVAVPQALVADATAVNASMDSLIMALGNEELATVVPVAPLAQETLAVPAEIPKPTKKKDPAVKPTLDESLKQVANEIRAVPVAPTPSGAPSTATTSSHSLATELERLANAAQDNRRQDVLVCGRSIAAIVNQICDTLRSTAKESTNPLVQDKLLKSSQALKNYSIQLKILTSVKAASNVDNNVDADDQLASMTRALGGALSEGLKAIDIHNKTHTKRK